MENKDLLLKVLCDGLPYGIIISYNNGDFIEDREMGLGSLHDFMFNDVDVKPYLRDMEDMTDDERTEFQSLQNFYKYYNALGTHYKYYNTVKSIDWLNKKHFNWRGLPEDMYIKVTEEKIHIKSKTMIQERYCSYEVAKLLKEKGFDEITIGYYTPTKELHFSFLGETNSSWLDGSISAPTPQMACDWLREIHRVFISIDAYSADHYEGYIDGFEIDIHQNASRIIVPSGIAIQSNYEEAVEAALKYVLENLI